MLARNRRFVSSYVYAANAKRFKATSVLPVAATKSSNSKAETFAAQPTFQTLYKKEKEHFQFLQQPLKRYYSTVNNNKRAYDISRVRNFAIIAHVDVGKTTLVDKLLQQTKSVKMASNEERVMDSMDLERERGITIMAKVTSVTWKHPKTGEDYFFNIVDTPGHADFGGEVERIMSMVDGVCLLVDATDGPMTQTRFVLSKALQHGLKPVVVINKVDRETARVGEVENEIFDLFVSLEASDDQCDFPTLYASAREGWALKKMSDSRVNMNALFETVIETFPAPKADANDTKFKMLATNLEYDRHFGRIMTGKIYAGKIKVGDKLKTLSRTGKLVEEGKVLNIMARRGLEKIKIDEAYAGEIVSIAGLTKTSVTDTICSTDNTDSIPTQELDPPIISVVFSPNDSPLAGKDGEHVSPVKVRDRLLKEGEINIALQVKQSEGDSYEVLGRGEMQIGVLVETMRREGYEFQISPPMVIFKEEKGKELEPIEDLFIDVSNDYAGQVMELMSKRLGELKDYKIVGDRAKISYVIPTRTLIGFGTELRQLTGGTGVLNHIFNSYQPHWGKADKTRKGVMVSMSPGVATAYALESLESRGYLFIKPQTEVYEGMIVGEHSREQDIEVNPAKEKHLTNMRAAGKEDAIRLGPIKALPLEEAIAYIQQDEMIEVTPKNIRLRKKFLSSLDRKKVVRAEKSKK